MCLFCICIVCLFYQNENSGQTYFMPLAVDNLFDFFQWQRIIRFDSLSYLWYGNAKKKVSFSIFSYASLEKTL